MHDDSTKEQDQEWKNQKIVITVGDLLTYGEQEFNRGKSSASYPFIQTSVPAYPYPQITWTT